MEDQRAGLLVLIDNLRYDQRDADCADQIIMASLLSIKAGLAAGGCVPLEGGNLLLQEGEGLEIWGIVKPAVLHQGKEVAYDQGLADVVVASFRVTAGRFATSEDDGIDLLPGHTSIAIEGGILLEVVPDRYTQAGGIEA